jgi:penicillin-binding protein 1C
LDNASGACRRLERRSVRRGEVDGITARRQAGSTLKPFLYADASLAASLTAAALDDAVPRRHAGRALRAAEL